MSRIVCLAGLSCLALVLAIPASGEDRARDVIVAFRTDGPHALEDCGESLFRRGAAFAGASRDGSDSLDRIHQRIRPRRIRALFRHPDGRSFAKQRAAWRQRLQGLLERRVGRPGPGSRASRRAGVRAETLPDLSHVYRVELGDGVSVAEAMELYRSDPHVAWVQRDHEHQLDALPNDPYLASSGSWGQAFEDLWGLYRIRAPEAWEISRGAGVVVAVVDTGLDYEHPDIADNVWVNPGEDLDGNGRVDPSDWNGVDDDGNGFVDDLRGWDFANSLDANEDGDFDDPEDVGDPDPFDDRGHGTHVAGTIAAVADNGIGIAGVAPEARIMALKGFPAEGPGQDSDLWRAVLYAAENGATVVNTSWSCSPMCPENPLGEEVVAIVHAMDVVIVTSAGNLLADVVFNSPENLRETITVASSGQDDLPSASFTNMGWIVDVAAPGGGPSGDSNVRIARRNILSLRSSADLASEPVSVGGIYYRNAGTSMSAPHVSGVVALLRSARPELGYEDLRRLVRQGAVDTGPPGHDRRMGAGRLDAWASLTRELPDLAAAITGPRQGSVFAPRDGTVVEIRGSAGGADLADWQLSYGIGNEPASWTSIEGPTTRQVQDDVLARWPVDGLPEGTYVVKLEVRGRDGSLYSEFLETSLEQNRFFAVSSPGQPAMAPDVSGSRVVWQSRRDPEDAITQKDDSDLYLTELAHGHPRETLLAGGAGNQHSASISGDVVAWLDGSFEDGHSEVFGCRLGGRGRCRPAPLAPGVDVGLAPAAAGGRLFWLDDTTGVLDVRACVPPAGLRWGLGAHGPGRCRPFQVEGLEPARRAFLRSDGAGLSWVELGNRFGTCEIDPRTGACPATRLSGSIAAVSRPTASEGLVAWVAFDATGHNPLQICELDPETGDCPPVHVMDDVGDPLPELSGDRLVWEARIGDEQPDVFFCEYDRLRDRCPVQRITAHMAPERAAAVDDRRVVWETDRQGSTAIEGIDLPALAPLGDQHVAPRRLLLLGVRAASGTPGERPARLSLAAESAGDAGLEALGARFFDTGRGFGVFAWKPRDVQVGSHLFTFSGTDEAGLVTRQTIRVEVEPAPGRWRDERPRRH